MGLKQLTRRLGWVSAPPPDQLSQFSRDFNRAFADPSRTSDFSPHSPDFVLNADKPDRVSPMPPSPEASLEEKLRRMMEIVKRGESLSGPASEAAERVKRSMHEFLKIYDSHHLATEIEPGSTVSNASLQIPVSSHTTHGSLSQELEGKSISELEGRSISELGGSPISELAGSASVRAELEGDPVPELEGASPKAASPAGHHGQDRVLADVYEYDASLVPKPLRIKSGALSVPEANPAARSPRQDLLERQRSENSSSL